MGKYLQGKKIVMGALYVSALCLALAACKKDDDSAQTYKADGDMPPVSHAMYQGGGALSDLKWNATGKNWKVLKTSPGMQRATFSVTGKEDGKGTPASAAISVIDGQAGGVVANVNRWRGQIGLEPLEEGKVLAETQHKKTGLGDMQWFEMANDKEKLAMLVSITDVDGTSVFVKLFGPADVVKENRDAFLALGTSLRYGAHDKK